MESSTLDGHGHDVGFGFAQSFRFRQSFCITVVATICLVQSFSSGNAAEVASAIVQSALCAEIDLDIDERVRLLDAALVRDPKLPEAHWARGEVRIRGQWLTLENAASTAKARADLEQYQQQRFQADATLEGQVRMAEYCRKHRLEAQERAHWTAVLALAPNHAMARQGLGQVNIDGAWIDARQFERQQETERGAFKFIQKHGKTFNRLSKALYDNSRSHKQVVSELVGFRDPSAIPALERFFSSRGEVGGLCTIDVLASLTDPEASLSLVRHVFASEFDSVRDAATDSLKRRDEHSYIPALLATLQNPVEKRDEFVMTRNNLLIWRRSLSGETQDVKKTATFDRVFSLEESSPGLGVATTNWTRQAIRAGDLELDQLNRNIQSNNTRVMNLLSKITEFQSSTPFFSANDMESKKTPEQWWNWWNDRIESFPSESKAVQTRYEIAFVPPSIIEVPSRARHECLAPGTPIWTETGPVAVDLVEVGDLVLTQNPRSGELKFAPVLATTNRPPELLLRLNLGGETLRTTGGHPFWVSGMGWVKARSLEPGMVLHTALGVVMLDSVEHEQDPTRTHNLIVDECHTYFVGTNRILSHDNTVREPVANRVPGLRDDIASTRTVKKP